MAELALAIIPLGIKVTSGLVKYLKAFKDHDDDRARLARQAERFASTFQSLEAALKRSQLNQDLSVSASEGCECLRECQKALQELDTLQQKIFATITSSVSTTPHARTKDKVKEGCKKLLYPLRKSDIEALEGALNKLSTALSLALGMLHLDEELFTRKILNDQMVEIQRNTVVNSNTSTVIEELRHPISRIGSSLPVLQTSVDAIVPHFDQRFDQISYQHVQMQAQIKSLLDMAGPATYQDRLGTNQQPLSSHSGEQGDYLSAREIQQQLRTLSKRDDSLSVYYFLRTLQGANSPFVRLTYEALVNFLIAAGTSVTVRNSYGDLAVHQVIYGTFVPASIYGQLNAGNDVEDRSKFLVRYPRNMRELLDYYGHNQSVARSKFYYLVQLCAATPPIILEGLRYVPVHYGPLGLAVIQNNLLEVERLISLHPHMLKEVSFYGETPWHIAIYRLDILEALAKKADPEVLIRMNKECATVLNLAIQVSHEICNPRKALNESCCPCTLPLRIILAAGCPIIPHRDFYRLNDLYIPEGSFFEASLHCKALLAKELRSRRQQLRDLARNNLSITELSNFTPLEEVPDVDAIEMDRLLRQKGFLGLGPLSTFADQDLPQRPCRDVGYYSRPIFFDLTTAEDADLFFDCDFKMICADEDRTHSNNDLPWTLFIPLDYAIWLFDHQAPLWKWSFRFNSPTPSVFVLADILGVQDYKCPSQNNISDRAEHYLSESALVDNCSCLCSPDGCTPFTSRMKWLARPHDQAEDLALQDYATRFGSHVEIYGTSLSLSHHIVMVRQAAFAALDLKHTCLDRPVCSRWPSGPHPMYWLDPVTELDPDEMEFEVLNVDVEARKQLEGVVVMFQDFVLTGRQTTISSKSDTFDIDYSAFNEPSALGIDNLYCQRVLEFWEHIWVNRMQVALDTVVQRWDSKLDGLNDLVQISTCGEAIQETRDSLKEGDDEEIFNRIIQQIQDI
ncbi:Ankyrin repeat-containing domain superfamily [Fusarium oxysporum f. sp. vasinfectum]|nr:Ankyrin repeat-containing domain superfamily [Fusarium oxysporum f. sp. vasinfectum]